MDTAHPEDDPGGPTAVLADDERLMREQLRARLAEAWPELRIVAEARNGEEAVEAVRQHAPDIVFLDIRMPGLDGLGAARDILQLERDDDLAAPELVFITAYDQHAIEAFDQGAADYVLKPAERDRLARTVQRLRQRLAARPAGRAPAGAAAGRPEAPDLQAGTAEAHTSATPADRQAQSLQWLLRELALRGAGGHPALPRPPLRHIQAAVGNAVVWIPVEEVLFFISDEKYTRVQTGTREALIRKPIKELLLELDPERFWQIHRSTLVNVEAIASVHRDERGRQLVQVRGHPQRLEVSRSFAGLFKGM